ncbi:MAG: large-conductance mechanosensitive channel protein MscL [Neisseria sp.]|nr:large-conductance mechanosensitive channel protein MscL [Neisseria sp.]
MKFVDEFKAFLMRGNVVDMAVGIVIGGAFTGIVKSLVDDVIMPPVGLLLGGVDFSNLFWTLKEGATAAAPYASLAAAKEAGAVTVNVGLFINTLISFIIVGAAVFFLVKAVNALQRSKEEPAETRECPYCCSEISVNAKRCPNCTSDISG